MTDINREQVRKKIESLLERKFSVDWSTISQEDCAKSIFLQPFNFDGIILVYLLAEIEKYFGIKIPQNYFDEYSFSTVDGIVNVVYQVCRENSHDIPTGVCVVERND